MNQGFQLEKDPLENESVMLVDEALPPLLPFWAEALAVAIARLNEKF
ncbi:MAG: hypothetical protein KME07_06760 [Pegethrix bostrychoides GSE-TBD4-15B]|uniref:Uncharacterized protein n=1 Tax=Pegethrix bostrychoides GSE-TBD4-15B TaxID=2839662 RepID=A0A951P8Y2_9CYAN|nr:hypothetical protein [Pegethrix bostrychoides GSE-TBD4-15B]